MSNDPLLTVRNLRVTYPSDHGSVIAVRNVGFTLSRERLAIVGESGSGKSTTGRAIMGLIAPPGRVEADAMLMGDLDLLRLDERRYRQVRGRRIGMVLQDPRFALDPVMSVGQQISETHRRHFRSTARTARRVGLEMLESVHIRDPERVWRLYPHEMSGGMGQRVMIGMMLIAEPEILIADEPTSALDVTVQGQVLAILDELVRGRGMGLILISHNLRLVAGFCDRVLVMYAGRIVESCAAGRLEDAQHPYTRALLASMPDIHHRRDPLPQMRRDPAWAEDAA